LIRKQLMHCPNMISYTYCHSWCYRNPAMTVICQIQHLTQTPMWCAEIVYSSQKIHSMMECCQLTNKRSSSTHQCGNPRPECAIYTFYVGCMCIQRVLRLLNQQTSLCPSTTSNTLDNACYTFAIEDRYSEHFLYSRYIRYQAIYAEQQRTIQSTVTHLFYQMSYEFCISIGTQNTTLR